MKLQLNGTGASEGFPSIFCSCPYCTEARKTGGKNIRHRTSSCIDGKILIDFSPDTYSVCTERKVDLSKIHHLIVTHSHADHFFPTDLHYLLPPFCRDAQEFSIYGNAAVHKKFMAEHKENPNLLSHVVFQELSANVPFLIEDYKITPIPTFHDKKEECFIYAVEKDGKEILYGHDSAMFPEETWKSLTGHLFSLVVLDCTSIETGHHFPNHMGIPDNRVVRDRMISEQMADSNTLFVLTHFAHSFNPLHNHVAEAASKNGFTAAYDGMILEV